MESSLKNFTVSTDIFDKIIETVIPKKQGNPFPIDVFPKNIQYVINQLNEKDGVPVDFSAGALLSAASSAIGNSHRIRKDNSFVKGCSLYMVLVSNPGTMKSYPLTWFYSPLQRIDKDFETTYQTEISTYKAGGSNGIEPKQRNVLLNDFTPEYLISAHYNNLRGITVFSDELSTWFSSLNRYNSSSESFYLTSWNGGFLKYSRKQGGSLSVENCFVNIVGTTQPKTLESLMNESRLNSGFVDRFLFIYLPELQKPTWREQSLPSDIVEIRDQIITNLFRLSPDNETEGYSPRILDFDTEAYTRITNWQKDSTTEANKPGNENMGAVYAKIEEYAVRFCLILELLKKVSGDSDGELISIDTVEGAIKLSEYFKITALKVRNRLEDPVEGLTANKQKIYNLLPQKFSTGEGWDICNKSKLMAERTFKDFIRNKMFFERTGYGQYSKIL